MKTKLPAHPHTANPLVLVDPAGKHHVRIHVSIKVPSRVAAMLAEGKRGHVIPSAAIPSENHVKVRAANWSKQPRGIPGNPLVDYLMAAHAEGCDSRITTEIPVEGWHLVGMLCGKLNITPGQWFLACAAYNAAIEEKNIETSLAQIPAVEAEAMEMN